MLEQDAAQLQDALVVGLLEKVLVLFDFVRGELLRHEFGIAAHRAKFPDLEYPPVLPDAPLREKERAPIDEINRQRGEQEQRRGDETTNVLVAGSGGGKLRGRGL